MEDKDFNKLLESVKEAGEMKRQLEDERREEKRLEDLEYQEELSDRQQSHKDAGVCESDFC